MRRLPPLLAAALLGSFLAATAGAQPAYMVADLGDAVPYHYDNSYRPFSERLEAGGKLYFFEDDGIHGRELWRSDGTALGTFLIRDLCPGSCGTQYPFWDSMAALGDEVVFAADDGIHGVELWRTDGTAAGTHIIADLRPGYASSSIERLTSASDQVFFTAQRDPEHASLWRTDGTAKGSYAITPPGAGGSFRPDSMHSGPGFLYLCNASWGGQTGLWRSDGSSAGTQFISSVSCWQNSIGKRGTMTVAPDGVLYFQGQAAASTDAELWRSNGTAAGTYRVKDIYPGDNGSWPSGLAWLGSELIFQASGPDGELWKSDGTEVGTVPIPLADGATPRLFSGARTLAGGRYYFAAFDWDHGLEPWSYDGATAERIADLLPGPDSSISLDYPGFQAFFEPFGGEAIFAASDGLSGNEIWRSNGTEPGTARISDIVPGSAGIHMPVFSSLFSSSLGGRPVIFEHQADLGERIWRTNAAGDSVELVDVLNSQTPLFEPRGSDRFSLIAPEQGRGCFEAVGSQLFFDRPRFEGSEVDLLRTDGALSGPEPILQAMTPLNGVCGSTATKLLYPRALDSAGADAELLALDSGSAAPELLLATGALLRNLPPFLDVGAGTQAFGAAGDLYTTDGTASGTQLRATGFDEYGGRVDRFLGEVVMASGSLWITDANEPTGARTLLAGDYDNLSVESEVAPLGPTLVFAAWDPSHGTEIWASDGTTEGTAMVMDANPGSGSILDRSSLLDRFFEVREPRIVGAETFAVFAGQTPGVGEELWVSDGTALGTGLLRDIYPGDYPSTPRQFTRLGAHIIFSAEDEEHGLELWVTDGTSPGTALLKDIAPGIASSVPDDLVVRDGTLYFSAWSPNYGREAWKSDGTAAGTVRISDIAPGPLSSSPQRFARAGNRLYFSATDQIHGFELWAISDDGSVPLFLDGFESSDTARWSGITL
ncbi:MAG: ELWxxDGT repeat protein [Thermoanaerobaculia bacterium]